MTNREANELAAQLWRLRELLETLLFKYDEQQLLLSAGRARWASRAAREIEIVADQLHDCHLATTVTMTGASAVWHLAPSSTLRELTMGAPGVWREILTDHFEALLGLLAEIETIDGAWGFGSPTAGTGDGAGAGDPAAAAASLQRPGVYSAQIAQLIGA